MPTLCGPDGLQKNSIERSVPKAEGAWSVFGYFLLTKKYQWPAFGWVFALKLLSFWLLALKLSMQKKQKQKTHQKVRSLEKAKALVHV